MAKKSKRIRWRILGLDVWGNADDGYEVNDRWASGFCYLPENPTDRQILTALKNGLGSDSPFRTKFYAIDGDDGFLSVDRRRDGKPLYQLERDE